MFLPNLDRDTVDAPGRREDGRHGRRRRTAAGLLTFGCWCTGRASCLFSSFGRHFLKRGGLVVFVFRTDFLFWLKLVPVPGCNELGEDEGAWAALKGSKSKETGSCLVYSFKTKNNRLLLLQLRV